MSHQSVCFLLNTSFLDLKCPFKVCAFISTLNRGTKMSHHDKNHTLSKVQRLIISITVVYKDKFDLHTKHKKSFGSRLYVIRLIIIKMTWKNSLPKKFLTQLFKLTSSFVKMVQDGENWNTRLDGTLIFKSLSLDWNPLSGCHTIFGSYFQTLKFNLQGVSLPDLFHSPSEDKWPIDVSHSVPFD